MGLKNPGQSLESTRHLLRATLLLAATTLLILTLGSYFAVREAQSIVREQVEASRTSLVKGLGLAIVESMAVRDYGALEARLTQATAMANLKSALATSPEGRLIARVGLVKGEVMPILDQLQFEPPRAQAQASIHQTTTENGDVIVWYPVQMGSLLGWLRLDFTPDMGNEALSRLVEKILLLILLAGGVMLLAFVLIMRRTHQAISLHEQGLQDRNVDLHSAARQDPLTGLLNRAGLMEFLSNLSRLATDSGERFAVCFLDLDRFKPINDQHGHDVGDQVLRCIAGRIQSSCRHGDVPARIGGDEFVVVIRGFGQIEAVGHALSRLIAQVCEPVLVAGIEARLGVSVGVSIFPDHGRSDVDLIDLADQAMYEAKRAGGGDWRLWTPA